MFDDDSTFNDRGSVTHRRLHLFNGTPYFSLNLFGLLPTVVFENLTLDPQKEKETSYNYHRTQYDPTDPVSRYVTPLP